MDDPLTIQKRNYELLASSVENMLMKEVFVEHINFTVSPSGGIKQSLKKRIYNYSDCQAIVSSTQD